MVHSLIHSLVLYFTPLSLGYSAHASLPFTRSYAHTGSFIHYFTDSLMQLMSHRIVVLQNLNADLIEDRELGLAGP